MPGSAEIWVWADGRVWTGVVHQFRCTWTCDHGRETCPMQGTPQSPDLVIFWNQPRMRGWWAAGWWLLTRLVRSFRAS